MGRHQFRTTDKSVTLVAAAGFPRPAGGDLAGRPVRGLALGFDRLPLDSNRLADGAAEIIRGALGAGGISGPRRYQELAFRRRKPGDGQGFGGLGHAGRSADQERDSRAHSPNLPPKHHAPRIGVGS